MADTRPKNSSDRTDEYHQKALEVLDELIRLARHRRETGPIRIEVNVKDGVIGIPPRSEVCRFHAV